MLRRLPALSRYLRRCAVMAVGMAVLIVAQAAALAGAATAAVSDGFASPAMVTALTWFVAAVIARSVLSWLQGVVAARAAEEVKFDLRHRLLTAAHPGWRGGRHAGETITLITRGIDGLDAYLTGYLPQLCLAATVPVTIVGVLAWNDVASAIVVVVTIPLMPIFGILIGWHTKARTEHRWSRLNRLGGHFLDAIAGLATSRVFGRAGQAAIEVREVADRYRTATMGTLKVAFLSALALELVAAVSVALVAVPIGLQLLSGTMSLYVAFLVLLLVPDVYLPLRAVGTGFHAAAEGLAACRNAFELTETDEDRPMESTGDRADETPSEPAVDRGRPAAQSRGYPQEPSGGLDTTRVTTATVKTGAEVGGPHDAASAAALLAFENVDVTYPGREEPALRGFSARVARGDTVAIVGPSGAGKSTIITSILGFAPVTSGEISLAPLGRMSGQRRGTEPLPEAWLHAIAWVPQRPHLFAMSVADNIRLGQPDADADQVRAAADAAFASEFIAELPEGFDTRLGDAGFGLSAGQCRRIALARAFLRIHRLDCPLILLDEPTASLDAHSEARVAEATAELIAGRTALLVAHRAALVSTAEHVWRIVDGRLTADTRSTAGVGT